jgi:hypothetical protein
MSKKLLPILYKSHKPQIGPREYSRAQHAELIRDHPEDFVADPDALPYACCIMEDGAQVLVDFSYRPLWWRAGECQPARRCDPREYFAWFSIYWLHDNWLMPAIPHDTPRHCKDRYHLRETLELVLEEFCNGGPLYVRRWKPDRNGEYMGKVTERVYWKHGMKVIERYD